MNKFKSQRGNIFTMLFAAVAMTGVLGVVGMQTVSGPITTITRVTQKNITDTDVLTNGRILILNASVRPENDSGNGAYDGDSEYEAVPIDATCTVKPTGGGCLPATIGAVLSDPWGTDYGYCTWNQGPVRTGIAGYLDGRTDADGMVVAVISAGPNKTFDTTCTAYDNNATRALDPGGVSPPITHGTRVTGTDDLAKSFTYSEAVAGAGGLWSLKIGDTDTAEIVKDLEIGDFGAGTGFSFDITTGEGEFPSVKTDILAPKTGNNVDMAGGLRLDDETGVANGTCGAASTAGILRWNTGGSLQVCDGTSFVDVGSDTTQIIDTDGDTWIRTETNGGVDNDTIRFATNGTKWMEITLAGIIDMGAGNILFNTGNGDTTVGSDIIFQSKGLIAANGELFINSDANNNGSGGITFGNGGQTDAATVHMVLQDNGDLTVDTDTLFVDAAANEVGINTIAPATTLHVYNGASGQATTLATGLLVETANTTIGRSILRLQNPTGVLATVRNNGKFGIGTNDPATRLHVYEGASGQSTTNMSGLLVETSLSGIGQSIFKLQNPNGVLATMRTSGAFGIGTDAPKSKLHVTGAVQVANDAGACNADKAGAIRYNGGNIEYCNATVWGALGGIVDKLRDILNVDIAVDPTDEYILQWDNVAKDWNAVNPTTLTVGGAGSTSTVIDADGDTQIQVDEGAVDDDTIRFDTLGFERMVIDSAGLVGIGPTAPNVNLHISGTVDPTIKIDATSAATDPQLFLDGQAGRTRRVGFQTNGVDRWTIVANSIAESGANAGSDFAIYRFNDAGTYVDTPLAIYRNNGTVLINNTLNMTSGKISNVLNPTLDQDAATKKYVDDQITAGGGDTVIDADGDTKIQVEEGADDDTIRFDTAGTERMTISATGVIDVGGTSALGQVTINNGKIHSIGDGGLAPGFYASSYSNTYYEGGANIYTRYRGTAGTPLAVQSNDTIGSSAMNTYNGTLNEETLRIVTRVDGTNVTGAGNHAGGRFDIITRGTSHVTQYLNTGLIKFTVLNDGKVGIGNASPKSKLHVDGDILLTNSATTCGATQKGALRLNATADGLEMCDGAGTWDTGTGSVGGSGDNLGNHTATTALKLGAQALQLGASNLQTLVGNGAVSLIYDSNHSTTTNMQFRDLENTIYGNVFGSGDGTHFGLLDGDSQWSYMAIKDTRTEFRINNITEMQLTPTMLDLNTNKIFDVGGIDASLFNGSGYLTLGLETAANIVMDNNEIMARNNGATSSLHIQADGGHVTFGNNAAGLSRLEMNTGKIIELGDPTAAQDATTKAYVDALVPANATNADTVDSLHAASFIRSDANDNVTGHTEWQDNMQIRLGTSADFRMWFDATNTYMRSYANGAGWYLQGNNAGGTNRSMIIADPDNSVTLYYAGAARLATTSAGATLTGNMTATAYLHSSDRRLKDNIETISGLDLISKLRGVTYDWKKDGKPSAGVIAQEVEKVLPRAVHTDEKGMKSVEYDQIIAPLIEAVKEIHNMIIDLFDKVANLFDKTDKIEAENKQLRHDVGELQKQNDVILKRLEMLESK